MTIRVLIVDDHPVFRDGLAAALAASPDIEVTGQASDGPEALDLARPGSFDVVVMDLSLPSMSGIQATAKISESPGAPAVIIVTMVDDVDTVSAALQAGARGYVLKGSSGQQIAAAVRTVAEGGAVLGPGIAHHMLERPSRAAPSAASDGLTDRERDVLALLADGASNTQIARTLGLSLKTVQNYVSRILDKLQVTDRTQAALRGRDMGVRDISGRTLGRHLPSGWTATRPDSSVRSP
jgi:DNA-binding NarL/FixJ family response regulator